MSIATLKTALVTGANSGLGFEAAAMLAERGFGRVILATRTEAKGVDARRRLVERVGADPFEVVAVDVGKNDTVEEAAKVLAQRGGKIDFLLLNAGMVSGAEIVRTGDGVEITVAASLVGHHVLTMALLDEELLTDHAAIAIAGSEAARGDVPMFGLTDVHAFAREHHDGDLVRAIETIARADAPYAYAAMPHYGMAKVLVAWWAAALSRRLPQGMTVNAISPGAAPDTNAMRNQPWVMQALMLPLMRWFGPLFGMGAPVSEAAGRYLAATGFDAGNTGHFYASVPGKMVGPVVVQTQPHVLDHESQEAAWQALVRLTGAEVAVPLRRVV